MIVILESQKQMCRELERSLEEALILVITRRRSFAEYWKHFVAHFNDFRASSYNCRKCTDLDEIWGTPSILSGAGPDRFWVQSVQKQEWESEPKFFCPVNNARLSRFLVSQISRNLHTRCGLCRHEKQFLKIYP